MLRAAGSSSPDVSGMRRERYFAEEAATLSQIGAAHELSIDKETTDYGPQADCPVLLAKYDKAAIHHEISECPLAVRDAILGSVPMNVRYCRQVLICRSAQATSYVPT